VFGLGLPEIIIILVIVLIIFGPSKLPQLGKALGEGIRSIRKSSEGGDDAEAKQTAEKAAEAPAEEKKDTKKSDA
jgi:sec-independent protein translocase protein TatA